MGKASSNHSLHLGALLLAVHTTLLLETPRGLAAALPAWGISELGEFLAPSTSASRLPRIRDNGVPLLQWSWVSSSVDPSVNSCAHLGGAFSLMATLGLVLDK